MDLATLDTRKGAEAGFVVNLLHPKTGEPTGASITVRGSDGDTYQEKLRERGRRYRASMSRNSRAAPISEEQIAADSLELIAACTIGWQGIDENGAPVPFSESAARSLYDRFLWIREQVEAAIHERGNFLPDSAKS